MFIEEKTRSSYELSYRWHRELQTLLSTQSGRTLVEKECTQFLAFQPYFCHKYKIILLLYDRVTNHFLNF